MELNTGNAPQAEGQATTQPYSSRRMTPPVQQPIQNTESTAKRKRQRKKTSMKPEKKLVKDLDDKVGPHTIRLKVIDKGNTQYSPNKRSSHYQRIVFQDEEVTMKPMRKLAREIAGKKTPHSIKVKVIDKTNFHTSSEKSSLESQVITFEDEEDAVDDGMEYVINNAEVDVLSVPTYVTPEQPIYHIYFNSKTTIQPIYGPDSTCLPEYILLASIPRELSLGHRYDVLGIVVYVSSKYQVPTHSGRPREACEVIIIDHSSEQVMIVTVWGEPAINAYKALQSMAPSFPVIGFTALRMSYEKGFSLETTCLTFTNLYPQGEDAASLHAWGEANIDLLISKNQQICEVRRPQTQRIITTIQTLLQKKVQNTLQEERHWLQVQLKEFDHTRLRLYLGCSHCGTGNYEDIEVVYTCTDCFTENAISTPRMAIKFEATDETGAYFFTALTKSAEQLLEVDATTLYKMLPQEREDYLGQVENQIRCTPIYIEVAPKNSLSRAQVLEWYLKQVSRN
ncbi:replication factor A protein 1-like isoform X3 [Silene latifolia]|uniref:replication factor A protein 1-like isoform X3 n=1 Tax=Silene latifolia TaxID=37657 RepID=UPI003D76ECD7